MMGATCGRTGASAPYAPSVREGIAPMTAGATVSFGVLLKRHRAAAGLTQEALAERARLSVHAVSALERGVNQWPHADTVALLTAALALSEDERAAFTAAARPPVRQVPLPAVTAPPPVHPSNLPLALTSFIGREQDLTAVQQLLGEARLLTLTGAGGCGKTRLALEVAGAVLADYPDGAWLVELASLSSPELVPQTLMTMLDVPEHAGRPHLATLVDFLQPKQLLLVLDNCEHLVGACAEVVTALLQGCGSLHIIATSRERLEVPGETTYLVPSLAMPEPWQLLPPEALVRYAAIRLCVERARARRSDFVITTRNAAPVMRICHRLDGIPLAIELAAARVDSMPVESIATRLDDCFQLLIGGPRTALPRQKTLRATLDWSYGLLSEPEQTLLAQLSVFAGGWTLEAAEAVGADDRVDARAVDDLLAGLVRKSLVLLQERQDGPPHSAARYRLLDAVRQYGQERLAAAGGTEELRARHLSWYLSLAEAAVPELTGSEQGAWLDRLESEHDNLRAALGRARASGQIALGMRLARALGRFWWMRGHLSEGRGWLEGYVAQAGSDATVPRALTATVIYWAGVLAGSQGDYQHAVSFYQDSLSFFQAMGDRGRSADCLYNLGVVAQHQGENGRAVRLLHESLVLRRHLGDTAGMAESLGLSGLIATWQGAYRQAETALVEALALYQDLEDSQGVASALGNLGWPAKAQGNYGQAAALSAESLAMYRALGDKQGAATMLRILGRLAHEQGDFGRSEVLLAESLALSRELGSKRDVATALAELAWVAYWQREHERAEALAVQSLALYRGLSSIWGIAFSQSVLAAVVHAQGDQVRAAGFYRESVRLYQVTGEKPMIAACLEGIARVACTQGQWQPAARLLGAVAALRDAIGAPLPPVERTIHERTMGQLRTTLGHDLFQAAWVAGRALPLEQAIDDALDLPGVEYRGGSSASSFAWPRS